MGETARANLDSLIGRLVIDQGLATEQEVKDCAALQKQLSASGGSGGPRALSDILVSNGIVTSHQLDRLRPLIDEYRSGQQIPGFQILGKLGSGAMATVYKAKQLSLDRIVAIKVLPKEQMKNKEFVDRFYAEGRAAAKLNHPNIVQAFDVGKAGDHHYFVMEYVEGRTLFDDIEGGKRYTEKEALAVIIQVAKALEHAHKAQLIHRDVKPKNIMLTADGTAKLADMGLARAISDLEAAEAEKGKAYGTPYYISPEQIRGETDVDFRADIYSLGATFYHLVTGQVPFDGPNPSAVMHKHLKSALTPPDHLNANLSAGIGEIIEVCMAKDKRQRYSSTTDLLTDLEAVERGEPPLQARKMFDLSSLTSIEQCGNGDTNGTTAEPVAQEAVSFLAQPLFWLAAAGWGMALVLLIIVIIVLVK